MWFKKTEIEKQIYIYGKDTDILSKLAKFTKKQCITAITVEDIKHFYTEAVVPLNSQWERNTQMLAIRKFFRYYRSKNCLRAAEVTNNSLKSVDTIAMIEPMIKKEKKRPGNPKNMAAMKKVKVMKDEGGLTFREIAEILKKDVRQVHLWYQYCYPEKYLKRG